MNQVGRIAHMEDILNEAAEAVASLEEALDRYDAVRDRLAYSGELWMKDFQDDAQGKIPKDLRRGVLSEDAVYNLLTDRNTLLRRMKELGKDEAFPS